MKIKQLVGLLVFVAFCIYAQNIYGEDERRITPISLGFTYSHPQYPANPSVTVYGLRAGVWMSGRRYDKPYHVQTDVYGLSVGLLGMDDYKVTGIQLSSLFNTADIVHGAQTSLFFNRTESLSGIQFSLGINSHKEAHGICIAGLGNGAGKMTGMQIAGLGNGASDNATGIQCTLGINVVAYMGKSRKNAPMSGIQVAGLLNYADEMTGIQLSPVMNIAPNMRGAQIGTWSNSNDMSGLQFGIANFAKELHGVQTGIFNMSKNAHGIQLGIVNHAENLKGIQIGLLNFKQGRFFPLVMIGW